ncbi:MAG: outer membrane lipoprotein-sorting protein [Treponema sp.]|nr:outer membrane lipoprotein-sorting protein [Treponema sp.]
MKHISARAFLLGITFFLTLSSLWALSDQELLARVDALVSYYDTDFSAEYIIVQDRPGQSRTTTVAGIFRRDSSDTYVIIVMDPVMNRGQGYLKQGDTLWFYDPQSGNFNSTSSTARFQNSNARNSDFTRSTLAQDYRVVAGANETLGRFNTRVLTLEAVTPEVTYPRMKIWICEDGFLRQTEDYSLSGQLLRTTAIPEYQNINGYYVPRGILMVDELRGAVVGGVFVRERTQITINRPSFTGVPDSVFSKTYLETVSR